MESRKKVQFRNYDHAGEQVKHTYEQMQINQNLAFVGNMKKTYAGETGYRTPQGNKIRISFADVPAVLDKIVDESDPDTGLPQIYHAYQTGEALRAYLDPHNPHKLRENIAVKDLFSEQEWQQLPLRWQRKFSVNLHALYPHITDWSWLPLVGFLHDSGKVLADKEWGALPQWAVVGDTFPVGAPFSKTNVYYEFGFFKQNPDLHLKNNKITKFGIYPRHCGLEKLQMSWGHDEYMYSVLHRTNQCLPDEALYIIRFHSFYPWHSPRDGKQGYTQLANDHDWLRLPLLKAFQKSDLYSKQADMPDQEQLKQYYMELMDRYVPPRDDLRPAKIKW